MDPSFTTGRSDGNLYSNNDIARILNARGVKTVRGKEWSHQLVDLVAQNALEKIKKVIIR
jgi:hypothetical protein